ncbi:MAG: RNA polymerase sigma factor [Acutalibacteraceae bacterium]|nr:RNA polymerase sigma factor [Acutalibacteraceae bacterium]
MTVFIKGKDAFSFAFKQFTDTVYRVALHNTANFSDAEDVTQEVFVKLLETNKAFRDSEHLKAWLIRVTINLCRDKMKKSSRETLVENVFPNKPNEDKSEVLEAVKALPEKYRNAIYLHYYEGYTAKEIGKILDAKESTVLSWLSRGRDALRKELDGGFDDE